MSRAVLEAAGLGADQQICRRLSRQALLRWLRVRRHRRTIWPSIAPSSCSIASFANVQAAFRLAGQPGRVPGSAASRATRSWAWHLAAGGHLTHGAPVNLSGKWFNALHMACAATIEQIDYDEVERLAAASTSRSSSSRAARPTRASSTSRASARSPTSVGACFMVDMAHFAGLVAGGVHPSPVPHAHVATTTTHKTLRGPRGGMILSNDDELGKKINSAIFPGLAGRPADARHRGQGGRFRRGAAPRVQGLRPARSGQRGRAGRHTKGPVASTSFRAAPTPI